MTFSQLYRPNSRFGGSKLNSLRQRISNMPSVKPDRVEKMNHRHWCMLGLLLLNASSNVHAQEDVNVVELAVKSRGIEAHLKAMADEGNKTAPYMIDKETQYASAVAIGKRLTTQWVFIKRQKAEIDVGALKQGMTEQGLTRLCTNPVSRMLINRYDATFSHTYSDKTGTFLFSFSGNTSACSAFKG